MAIPPLFGFTILGVFFTCTVLAVINDGQAGLTRVARNRVLAWLGVISFGVYLSQLPVPGSVGLLLGGEDPGGIVKVFITAVAWLLPLPLAHASWLFFARRFVEWGRSFKYERIPPVLATATATA